MFFFSLLCTVSLVWHRNKCFIFKIGISGDSTLLPTFFFAKWAKLTNRAQPKAQKLSLPHHCTGLAKAFFIPLLLLPHSTSRGGGGKSARREERVRVLASLGEKRSEGGGGGRARLSPLPPSSRPSPPCSFFFFFCFPLPVVVAKRRRSFS